MHRNGFFRIFLLLLGVFTLFYVTKATLQLWPYLRYSATAEAQIENWQARKVGSDHYGLWADYSYCVGDQDFTSHGRLQGHAYRNLFAAEEAIEEMGPLKVYFSPRKPQKSTLEHYISLRRLFYAAILVGILIYFLILGRLVGLGKKQTAF